MNATTLKWGKSRIRFGILIWAVILVSGIVSVDANRAVSYADQPIQIKLNEHAFVFGQHVRFRLEATGEHPIKSVVLAYRTLDTHGTTVEAIEFDPNLAIELDYVHDIQSRYIRPFVQVSYWWTIEDVVGNRLITEPKTFDYADNRFDWQTLQDGVINIHWYKGELQIVRQALNTSLASLDRARRDIPIEAISKSIDIYLYANPGDVQDALPSSLVVGEEARTFYETNVIVLSFGPEAENIPRLQRVLPHEITHALIHEATQSDFARVPLWLSEGLATSVEYAFMPDPNAHQLLKEAIEHGNVISLRSLCGAFPANLGRAKLAYAQSASLINFVRDTKGRQTLHDLIAAYADGATCEGGVQRVLRGSLDRLESQWVGSLAPRSKWAVFWDKNGAWAILFLLLAGFPFFFAMPARTRH
jgi:hypothetical protein